jgi:cytochrome c oxidase subunit 2
MVVQSPRLTLLRATALACPWVSLPLLASCAGVQSTFSAFGAEAETTRAMTYTMGIGAAVITIAVLLLTWHAVRAPPGQLNGAQGVRVILWAGAVLPTVVLTILLVVTLPTMRSHASQPGELRIHVDGEQFWWRVRYEPPGGAAVETANEIRVPVGRTIAIQLSSPDVIHSFWVPGLAGKVDMIPGRVNELVVRPTRAGTYRGQCAEFCGLSHARMALDVIAMDPVEFDRWLEEVALPAVSIDSAGRRLFSEYGCDGCHTIRGHVTGGRIGPELTHYGARRTLAAGTLTMSGEATRRFIRNSAEIKPGSLMPAFGTMPDSDAQAIASYLLELR